MKVNSNGSNTFFDQVSAGLAGWVGSGFPAPTDSLPSLESLAEPCSGECRYASIISTGHDPVLSGDPCVYTNDNGTYNSDPNSSPKECSDTGGHWVPANAGFTVDSDGTVHVLSNYDIGKLQALGAAGVEASNYLACVAKNAGTGAAFGAGLGYPVRVGASYIFPSLGGPTPFTVGGAAWGAVFGYTVGGLKGILFTC